MVWFECEMYLLYGLLCLNTWLEQLMGLCGKVLDLSKKKAYRRNRIHVGRPSHVYLFSVSWWWIQCDQMSPILPPPSGIVSHQTISQNEPFLPLIASC